GAEIAGLIYGSGDQYGFTAGFVGTAGTSNPLLAAGEVPAGEPVVGSYHTHPSLPGYSDPDLPGWNDRAAWAAQAAMFNPKSFTGYYGTSDGGVYSVTTNASDMPGSRRRIQ